MNGFANHGLDESAFGDSKGLSAVKAFDAFPKTKPSYQTRTSTGGVWTLLLILASTLLTFSEIRRWFIGHTTHAFSVEKGISHDLQINLDIVVAMKCHDLHINVQDASGDRILAGEALTRHDTVWAQWGSGRKIHRLGDSLIGQGSLGGGGAGAENGYQEEDVHDYLGAARRKRKFAKTPKLGRGVEADSCRIFGSLEGNKVQGDFHITARGHGYMEFGQHLDHSAFNFSHQINELSFGPFYPSLTNPLDNTLATTDSHFFKYQYYLSVVPTIYTTDASALTAADYVPSTKSPASSSDAANTQQGYLLSPSTVFTNQYAVTEQSHVVGESQVPGVFVKFDIEPILLTIAEEWGGLLALLVRLVNVVSGVLVAGGWCYQLSEWAREVWGMRGRRRVGSSMGMLHGGGDEKSGMRDY
ncbi:hypothetical protein B0A49_08079 [Cryomyces minteri]|uniref:Endoplasmic reticulum-Golgi intermediate compartment protein n=1 Tax=Cryomyces minteri TaxID=331657 RepID=A0A4U0XFP2_9PEZI|nr:hypothetical protein B0A49_08079 [Cryomyces minteri]